MSNSRFFAFQRWFNSSRFEHIRRPYVAKDLEKFLPEVKCVYGSNEMSKRLYFSLREHQKNKTTSFTFGALDPIQITQMTPYLENIYVSGWQTSVSSPDNSLIGPDMADYTYSSVPNRVKLLYNTMEFHQTKNTYLNSIDPQKEPQVTYMRPLIADADNGHGGLTSMMKLTRMFIESGAAGIHIEDQKVGDKKCGHMSGKILCKLQTQIDRLIASRLQADILQNDLVIISRTDAESGNLLDNDSDVRDHPFILGKLKVDGETKIGTIDEAKRHLIEIGKIRHIHDETYKKYFSWNDHRTPEGYYYVKCGVKYSIARAIEYSPYCDSVWYESTSPNLKEAKEFADGVKKKVPHMMLSYNLSPSFNWDTAKLSDLQIKEFISELGKMGYTWVFITLAGVHLNGLACNRFVKSYTQDGMLGYVKNIQRKEREHNVDILKHQKYSGIDLIDKYVSIITSNQSSSLGGKAGSTENQFK